MTAYRPIETRSALPLETREQQDDPLAAVVAGVEELRSAAEQHRSQLDERLGTEVRTIGDRIAALETRLNRPGAGQQPENANGPAAEVRAFSDWARSGNYDPQFERRDLDSGTSSTGAYVVAPDPLAAELIRNLTLFNPIRQYARTTVIGGAGLKLPKRTTAMTATWAGEGDTSTETAPAYGQVAIPAMECRAFTDVSNQLLEDAGINLASELAVDAAEAFGVLEAGAFLNGTGSANDQPSGILTDTAVLAGAKASGHASTLGSDPAGLLIDMFYSLKAPYRRNAVWAMNSNLLAAIRKLKDTNTGQFLWQPGLKDGEPSTLLGRPVIESPEMDDIGANKLPILLGDFSNYRIVERLALSTLRDPYSLATISQVRFHWRRRVGGAVTKAEGFKVLKVAAS